VGCLGSIMGGLFEKCGVILSTSSNRGCSTHHVLTKTH